MAFQGREGTAHPMSLGGSTNCVSCRAGQAGTSLGDPRESSSVWGKGEHEVHGNLPQCLNEKLVFLGYFPSVSNWCNASEL